MVLCSGEVSHPAPGGKFQEGVCRFDKKRILVPTDFSKCSRYALEWALCFARSFGCAVVLLDVEDRRTLASASQFEEVQEEVMREIDEEFDAFAADLPVEGIPVERVIGSALGDPTDEILRRARETDLIVIPSPRGIGLSQTLLERIAEKVIQNAPCPVLCTSCPPGE